MMCAARLTELDMVNGSFIIEIMVGCTASDIESAFHRRPDETHCKSGSNSCIHIRGQFHSLTSWFAQAIRSPAGGAADGFLPAVTCQAWRGIASPRCCVRQPSHRRVLTRRSPGEADRLDNVPSPVPTGLPPQRHQRIRERSNPLVVIRWARKVSARRASCDREFAPQHSRWIPSAGQRWRAGVRSFRNPGRRCQHRRLQYRQGRSNPFSGMLARTESQDHRGRP